jgi:hypothetical protein
MYYQALVDWRSSFRGVESAELYSLTWEEALLENGEVALAHRERAWRQDHPDEVPRYRSLTESSAFHYAWAIVFAALLALLHLVMVSLYSWCARLASSLRERHGSLQAWAVHAKSKLVLASLAVVLVVSGSLVSEVIGAVTLALLWPAVLLSRAVVVLVDDARGFKGKPDMFLRRGRWFAPLGFFILLALSIVTRNYWELGILVLLAWAGALIGYSFGVVRAFFVERGVVEFGGRRFLRALAVMALLGFGLAAVTFWGAVKSSAWYTVPYGVSDSLGSASQRAYWRQKADESGKDMASFVAGVAYQLSGDPDSARRYYSDSALPGAAQNLQSLNGENPSRPVRLPTFDDLIEAAAADQSPLRVLVPITQDGGPAELRPAVLALDLLLVLGAAALVASFWSRAEEHVPRELGETALLTRVLPATRLVLEGRPYAGVASSFLLLLTLLITIAPAVQAHLHPDDLLLASAMNLNGFDLPFGHHLSGFAPWECAGRAWFIAISTVVPLSWLVLTIVTQSKRLVSSATHSREDVD